MSMKNDQNALNTNQLDHVVAGGSGVPGAPQIAGSGVPGAPQPAQTDANLTLEWSAAPASDFSRMLQGGRLRYLQAMSWKREPYQGDLPVHQRCQGILEVEGRKWSF